MFLDTKGVGVAFGHQCPSWAMVVVADTAAIHWHLLWARFYAESFTGIISLNPDISFVRKRLASSSYSSGSKAQALNHYSTLTLLPIGSEASAWKPPEKRNSQLEASRSLWQLWPWESTSSFGAKNYNFHPCPGFTPKSKCLHHMTVFQIPHPACFSWNVQDISSFNLFSYDLKKIVCVFVWLQ